MQEAKDVRILQRATIIMAAFLIIEIIGGIWSGSIALLADAGHMTIDVISSLLALFSCKISGTKEDSKRTFGYKRAQVIAAFINGITLLITIAIIIFEAIDRLIHPSVVNGHLMVTVGIFGVIANILVTYTLLKGSKNNLNIKSTILHEIGDLLGYVGAVIAGLLIIYFGYQKADPILSIFFSAIMLKTTWELIKSTIFILMEAKPDNIDQSKLVKVLKSQLPDFVNLHHIHIWSLSPEDILMTAHLKVKKTIKDLKKAATIIKEAKKIIAIEFGIKHVILELENDSCSDD